MASEAGHWITTKGGTHIFIKDGQGSTVPKISSDIGNKVAKGYDEAKDDFQSIVDYFNSNSEKKSEFLKYLADYPYVTSDLVMDVSQAFNKNDPKRIFNNKGYSNFLRAYLKYTNPDMSSKDIESQVLSTTQKKSSSLFGGEDLIDKQSREIEQRAKEAKELNDERRK